MSSYSWGDYSIFVLKNNNNMSVHVSDLGATIVKLFFPDNQNNSEDMVLGYDTPEEYLNGNCYFGGIVGPWANRIKDSIFYINDKKINLEPNEGHNHLHGASAGLHIIRWQLELFDGKTLILRCKTKKGVAGYPSDIGITVTFSLNDDNELIIKYYATSSDISPINLTSHPYFNLTGKPCSALNHRLRINSNHFLSVDKEGIPVDKTPTANTPFDFNSEKIIYESLDANDPQIRNMNGYDHCWVLSGDGIKFAATLSDPLSGRKLEVFTDQPGLQFYGGQHLSKMKGKYGSIYDSNSGVCLETQRFPNQPNSDDAESCFIKPYDVYTHLVIYKFSISK